MIYITGDAHGDFIRISKFTEKKKISIADNMIILGDVGINYYEDERYTRLKNGLHQLSIFLFCIHGNHEKRPENISEQRWNGGRMSSSHLL